MFNLNYLQYAVEVYRCRSITQASQRLFVSQPYLSSMMKRMEEELGFAVFKRTNTGVELTGEGESFIHSAQKILLEAERITQIPQAVHQPLLLANAYSQMVSRVFLEYRRQRGDRGWQDRLYETTLLEGMQKAEEEQVGILFLSYATEKEEKYTRLAGEHQLVVKNLMRALPLYVRMAESHPLSREKSIPLEVLKTLPIACYSGAEYSAFFRLLGIDDEKRLLFITDRFNRDNALHSGYVAVEPYQEPDRGILSVRLTGVSTTLDFSYAIRRDRRLNFPEKEFLEQVKNACRIQAQSS